MTWPWASVMLTSVLLKVAKILAMPLLMFFAPLALTIFLPAKSSASNSAAVGAATLTGAAPATSAVFGVSAEGAASPAWAAPFLGARAGCASAPAFAAGFSAAASALPSFLGFDFFFVSSAIFKLRVEG